MLSRMWTAESEKVVTAALIDEYAAAATTAKGLGEKGSYLNPHVTVRYST